jgi:hypothetical protein
VVKRYRCRPAAGSPFKLSDRWIVRYFLLVVLAGFLANQFRIARETRMVERLPQLNRVRKPPDQTAQVLLRHSLKQNRLGAILPAEKPCSLPDEHYPRTAAVTSVTRTVGNWANLRR